MPQDQMVYVMLKSAQRSFGRARFEMGVLLNAIKEKEFWKGRASSFASFLEEERINSSAAYQYMRVTRKLFNELKLSDREFDRLSTVNMGILDIACQMLCEDNKGDLIDVLTSLGERDAKQELLERLDMYQPQGDDSLSRPKRSQQVNRVLNSFYDLPDDQRIEFLEALNRPTQPRMATKGNEPATIEA